MSPAQQPSGATSRLAGPAAGPRVHQCASVVYVNGKFLAQRLTGVQRAATEWLRAVDEELAAHARPGERWVLLHPPQARAPVLRFIEARLVGRPGMPLHAWEQWTLPRAARDGVLLNLAGSAPWFVRRQLATLHDAALWDVPQAYAWAFRSWYRALFAHLARHALRLLTISEFSRSRLSACLGRPARDIALLPNGADHLAAVPGDARVLDRLELVGQPYFLAVASANPSKNLARLVEAFAKLQARASLRLVLVGGSNARVFADAALPREERVLRVGAVDDASLKALYAGALALIQPSLYEGFGLPPLEAMACGCPVGASRVAALPEVCGDAAIYFDPLSVDDIAAAMRRLLEDDALRESLRRAGSARAAAMPWGAAARRLLEEVRAVT